MRATAAVAAVVLAALALVYAVRSDLGADYASPNCPRSPVCDDSARSMDALLDGDAGRFFRDQPASGPLSLVWRAPWAGAARALDGDTLDEYRAGAFACLLGLVALGVLLVLVLRRAGRPLWLQVVAGVGCVLNPMTQSVLVWGHPEDALAGSLTVGALVLAISELPLAAGVVLGLAIAAKLWALLAVLPLLAVSARAEWRRLLVRVAAVAAVFIVPMVVGDPSAFRGAIETVGHYGSEAGTLTQASAWWVFGHDVHFTQVELHAGMPVLVTHEGWALSSPLARIAHPLVAAVAVALALVWWRHWPALEDRRRTVLALVALIFLLRAPLDPADHSYYHLPFLLSLLAWETVSVGRVPIAAALAAVGLQLIRHGPATLGDGAFNAVYLAGCAVFVVYLLAVSFGRGGTLGRLDGVQPAEQRAR